MRSMKSVAVFLVLLILFSPIAFAAEEHLLPLQGTAKLNDVRLTGGSIIVEIYDNVTGGNLVYNSTNDFLNVISDGAYDILLGNGSQPLSLNYGTKYYMDMYINNVDVDFNNSERQVFMSTVGNLSVTTPIRTNSTDSDDALNISNGGAFFGGNTVFNNFFNVTTTASAVRTNGTVTILSAAKPAFSVNNAVNISGVENLLTTNSTIAIQAFSEGRANAFTVNRAFNITGADGAVRTNSTVTIVSLLSPALSINGFNVSGSNAALSTNGTATIAGQTTVTSNDGDDALNVSNGGGNFRGQLGVQNYTSATIPAFTVNYGFNVSGASSALSTNGTVTILSLASPALSINGFNVSGANGALTTNSSITMSGTGDAFSINGGFNISGSNTAVSTNGTVSIVSLLSPALSINGFNVSGANSALSTNGTVTIVSLLSPALSINGFNVSGSDAALSTNGTVIIRRTTAGRIFSVNDAFNISGDSNVLITNSTIAIQTFSENRPNAFTVNRAFNITGADGAVRTNSTVTILSLLSPALSINGFNVSGSNAALSTNGTIAIFNPDLDDALNVTGGTFMTGNLTVGLRDTTSAGVLINEQGSIIIGNASSTNQPRLDIYDGGTDNCAYIRLYDEAGDPHYLYVATTGELMINVGEPSTCSNTDGAKVGAQ